VFYELADTKRTCLSVDSCTSRRRCILSCINRPTGSSFPSNLLLVQKSPETSCCYRRLSALPPAQEFYCENKLTAKCTVMQNDWLTALRHISTERLLVPRNVANKIWSRFVDKYNCVWRNADRPHDTSVQKATGENENVDAV